MTKESPRLGAFRMLAFKVLWISKQHPCNGTRGVMASDAV